MDDSGGAASVQASANRFLTLLVVFAPQSASIASATLAVAYDDTFASPLIASRALVGTGD